MPLDEYRRKRDPVRTPEPVPEGEEAAGAHPGGEARFVVQQHDARRMHFDLRLELDQVLVSWAVPRGPSLDPDDRRLAVRTEDHPLAYARFEGVIPEGEYGAGPVIVWDHGTWSADGDDPGSLAEGRLRFRLDGEKLSGGWRLVRTDGEGVRARWLLLKVDDAAARREGPPVVETAPHSVLSGRTVEAVAAGEPAGPRREDPEPLPDDVAPQLATRREAPPTGPEWASEVKHDGYRLRARRQDGRVILRTRNGHDWTARFPALARAVAGLPGGDLFLDGELVVLRADGRSDFAALQAVASGGEGRPSYVVFDVLYAEGRDLRDEPLRARQEVLARLLPEPRGPLRRSRALAGRAADLFREACELSLEGIVSKRRDAPYRSGRTRTWVKVKCDRRATLPIVGFTAPGGSRPGLGALLLARPTETGLASAGRVGSGFSRSDLEALRARLEPLARPGPALDEPPRGDGVTWVEPRLAARIRFQTWTAEGRVRHARFEALEEARPEPEPGPGLTHPDRILWPQAGVDKAALARLYRALAPRLLASVRGRPLTLVRAPEGLEGPSFWQKRASPGLPPALRRATDPETGRLFVDEADQLVALAQIAALELHVPTTTRERPDHPDRLILDLDPGEGVGWPAMAAAALVIRERLAHLGLTAFVKATGGRGLHLVAPLRPEHPREAVRDVAAGLARELARQDPDRYVAHAAKADRHGRIFLDWMRNSRGATAVATWSPRARPGAFTAVPLAWSEVDPDGALPRVPLPDAPARPDPWTGFARAAADLPPEADRPGG